MVYSVIPSKEVAGKFLIVQEWQEYSSERNLGGYLIEKTLKYRVTHPTLYNSEESAGRQVRKLKQKLKCG